MRREDWQRLAGFVLFVLACGGGCITPYRVGPIYPQDLAIVGVDDHNRARLQGLTDPRPGDPEPQAQLTGRLLVYPGTFGGSEKRDRQRLERLSQLDSITDARVMHVDWNAVLEDRHEPIDFSEALLRSARAAEGDVLLFFVYHAPTDATYLTLTLAQWLTLGFAPTVLVSADADIEAAIIDVHTGYIYALGEGTGDNLSMTNHWGRYESEWETSRDAVGEALDAYVDRLEAAWPAMRETYH